MEGLGRIFVSVVTGAHVTMTEVALEAQSLIQRYEQADKTSKKIYILHFKGPNGFTGHGQPKTVEQFRAVLNNASIGPDEEWTDPDGIVHWLVPFEEVD